MREAAAGGAAPQLNADRLIEAFDFQDIDEAVAATESGKVVKPVVVFS